jgi:hypothetical protein
MNQLLRQVEEGGPRPCGVEGESSVEVWRLEMVGSCLLGRCGARPFQKGAPLLLT